jgi:hypothetical protein
MSRLAHGEVSVCQQGGRGEPASGPIELHYTRADVDEEDMPWLEIDQFPRGFRRRACELSAGELDQLDYTLPVELSVVDGFAICCCTQAWL